jgi:heat shock protein HtpX
MSLAVLRRNMVVTMVLLFGTLFVIISVVTYYFDVGMVITVPLVLIFIVFQWLLSPSIVSASTKLRYLKKGENPFLENMITDLAKKSKVPVPRIAVVPDKTPNAFVFGRTTSSTTLAVHEGLLQKFRPEEIEAVVAHEIGHIKHKDVTVMTLASAVPLVAYVVARSMLWGSRGSRKKDAGSIILVALVSYVVYLVSQLLVLYLSRSREHYADTYSAYLTGEPRNLRSALAKIAYGLSLSPKESTGLRAFYIGDPQKSKEEITTIIQKKSEYDLDRDGVLDEHELELAMEKEAKSPFGRANDLFSTHPSTFKRILLLKRIEDELNRGTFTGDIYRFV